MERNNHSGVCGQAEAAHYVNRWILAAGLSLVAMCAAGLALLLAQRKEPKGG